MYKLLLVDDEDIEREGMAELIPWESCEMQLMDTAWNGVEGYEKLKLLSPDVVITDIKMPVMNGIEFIKRSQELFPDTVFIVLSGYGEYEYTSQAMELGVRHYILKPCDDKKIIGVLKKVSLELKRRQTEREEQRRFRSRIRRLLPRAKEQIFRNMLLNREQIPEDYTVFTEEIGENSRVGLLAFRSEKNLDYLEQFVLGNILTELFGQENIYLNTMVKKDALFLLKGDLLKEQLEPLIKKVKSEFFKFEPKRLKAAVSSTSEMMDVPVLYEEILNLFEIHMSGEPPEVLSSRFCEKELGENSFLFDYGKLKKSVRLSDILFECYLGFVKMEVEHNSLEEKKAAFERCLFMLYGEGEPLSESGKEWDIFEQAVHRIAKRQGMARGNNKEDQRMQTVLFAVYKNIRNPKLSIQFLARDILFINEDYLGRLFKKSMNEKYSDFIWKTRIRLALRLLWFQPDIKISRLAELVGYPPDGQYFAKALKKSCGMSPSEYRKSVKNRKKEI